MITRFLHFFSQLFSKSSQNTHLTAYTTQTFSKQAVVPLSGLSMSRTDYCAAIVARSPVIALFSKTRLKYYFNTAHCYQDLHCSLMYRCPTAVLITRDTAKSAFHYNLHLSPAITCRAVHCQLSNIPLHCTQLLATCPACPSVVLAQFASPQFSSNLPPPSSRPICLLFFLLL